MIRLTFLVGPHIGRRPTVQLLFRNFDRISSGFSDNFQSIFSFSRVSDCFSDLKKNSKIKIRKKKFFFQIIFWFFKSWTWRNRASEKKLTLIFLEKNYFQKKNNGEAFFYSSRRVRLRNWMGRKSGKTLENGGKWRFIERQISNECETFWRSPMQNIGSEGGKREGFYQGELVKNLKKLFSEVQKILIEMN